MFESLEVPNSIFTSFERTTLSAFSRFKMVSNLPSSFVDEKEKLIYSLTLKLLNRGIVNSKNEKYSNVLREKFNDNCTGELNSLFDYQSYGNMKTANHCFKTGISAYTENHTRGIAGGVVDCGTFCFSTGKSRTH